MKRFKIVAWYAADPLDEHVAPVAYVTYLLAETGKHALDRSTDELADEALRRGVKLLNQYACEAASVSRAH